MELIEEPIEDISLIKVIGVLIFKIWVEERKRMSCYKKRILVLCL